MPLFDRSNLISDNTASNIFCAHVLLTLLKLNIHTMSLILTLNAGSSSIKYSVYLQDHDEPNELIVGQVENLGPAATLSMKIGDIEVSNPIGTADHALAVKAILKALEPHLQGETVVGVGHRVVHGGAEFSSAVVLDDDVLERLTALTPLAPLHQPHNLACIHAAITTFPDAAQIACFDTAFHRGHSWVNDTFAIPKRFYEKGVRRYGFHGLSYDFISSELERNHPNIANSKVVVAHLGNGASMCALDSGESVGSTMGFSALDGLPMGTRCGQLDPGVLLYLMELGHTSAEISRILYKESGLKGLSGFTSDMRELLTSDVEDAHKAIDYYVYRIRREVGAMAAILGGLDALVFCGGIGENAHEIRARIVENLGFLGLKIDEKANMGNQTSINSGATPILIINTDEERVIARAVDSLTKR
jgi:acetate kinase